MTVLKSDPLLSVVPPLVRAKNVHSLFLLLIIVHDFFIDIFVYCTFFFLLSVSFKKARPS